MNIASTITIKKKCICCCCLLKMIFFFKNSVWICVFNIPSLRIEELTRESTFMHKKFEKNTTTTTTKKNTHKYTRSKINQTNDRSNYRAETNASNTRNTGEKTKRICEMLSILVELSIYDALKSAWSIQHSNDFQLKMMLIS